MSKKNKKDDTSIWYLITYTKQRAFVSNDWLSCKRNIHGKSTKSFSISKFKSQEDAVLSAYLQGYTTAQIYIKVSQQVEKDSKYYQEQIKDTTKGWHIAYKNRKAFVFDNWNERKHILKGATYKKGFETKDNALSCLYDLGYTDDQIKVYETTPFANKKICPVCEKIYGGKNKLCPQCNTIKNRLGLTIWVMCAIVDSIGEKTIFAMSDAEIMQEARKIWATKTKKECVSASKEKRAKHRTADFRKEKYHKECFEIPDYIRKLFEKDKTKEIICVDGYKINPNIYFTCKRCGKEICQTCEDVKTKKGHGCDSNKSSGEVLVEEYLKQLGVYFKTQRDTIQCINPKTKCVMPYDFELPKNRIIIEVQGKQHFEFIEHFHGTIENFEYQQWKDVIKKEYAEKLGYRVVYINYQELESGAYKDVLARYLR